MFRVSRRAALASLAFALSFGAPLSAGADDASTATSHPYGSVDRPVGPSGAVSEGRDAGKHRERLRAVLGQLPEADRERAVRRLRGMTPLERRRFFRGFQGLSPDAKRERFIGWVAQGRREAALEERQEKLQDLRGNLEDGLSPREKRRSGVSSVR